MAMAIKIHSKFPRRILTSSPDNKGVLLWKLGRFDQAKAAFDRLAALGSASEYAPFSIIGAANAATNWNIGVRKELREKIAVPLDDHFRPRHILLPTKRGFDILHRAVVLG